MDWRLHCKFFFGHLKKKMFNFFAVHLLCYNFFVFIYIVLQLCCCFFRERLNFAFQGSMWISLLLYVRHHIQVQGSSATVTCKNIKTSSLMWRYWLISFCCEKMLSSCVLLLNYLFKALYIKLQSSTFNIYSIVH